MAAGKLYTYPDSFRAQKILIAAEYSGTKIEVPAFTFGKDNHTAEFLKKFPLGKVPAFETKDGKCLYESNAIAHYVANEQLRGSTAELSALVVQYVNFADQELLPAAATWVFPTYGMMQYHKQSTDKAMEDVKKYMTMLNDVLLMKTFLVGERVTLADIAVCCVLQMLYKQVMEPSFRAPYGNVNRWFTTCVNQPEFKKILGDVKMCDTMAKFDSKTFNSLHHKDHHKKKAHKEEKPKQEKKKAEPKKVEEPKEQEPPKKPAKADPFAALPPSSMNLDAWKKVYSNEDTESKAIPYFWENFDKEGYSLWFLEYKEEYEKDLGMVFMACNLVGGMIQRLEKLVKNGFGSICIFGENHNCSIAGVWMFRGQQLAFELNEDWNVDAPSYTSRRLNPDDPADKKLIEDYFIQREELTYRGKKFNQGKVFK
ncbi:elongation factor 1-gamma-A [Nematostella vectensis]|uniref:elongation factor 1-gamma-A n=1 Tax=Nematostella vectensis TaxID=45351 RepID=UPI002076F7E0|nr:elongation factor 1-gamma-A [Nematostella vectensis]